MSLASLWRSTARVRLPLVFVAALAASALLLERELKDPGNR